MSNMDIYLEGLDGLAKVVGKSLDEAVHVDTTSWQNSTGKKVPSGNGMWIFTSERDTDLKPEDEGHTYIVSKGATSYADAKKQAVAWAKEKGHIRIHLGS